MRKWLSLGCMVAASVLALGATACGSDDGGGGGGGDKLSGSIAGAGSSAQEAAMQAWIAGLQGKNPDVTVSYDPVGSGGGREQFVAGATPFGGSDAALADKELTGAQKRCGGPDNLVEVPVYISPIAMAYKLEGVDKLQLSPETLAKIFKAEITTWNDPAIAKDNPGTKLPSTRITPVHRSDESGTTENFTDYLSKVAGSVWTFEVSGDWPVKGGEAAQGTSGVVDAIRSGEGTIGYADASQAGDLTVANVKVGETFVEPSAEAASKILDASKETDDPGQYVFTFDLARETKESGTYPIVLVSYQMACTKYDKPDEGKLVKGLESYIISKEGQQAAAKAAGSAPITEQLRGKIQPAVDAIGGGA